jgi:hypothetical protein
MLPGLIISFPLFFNPEMNKILIHLLLVYLPAHLFPQEINWGNFSGGIIVNTLFTEGDLESNWDNTPEAGLILNYLLDSTLSLEGAVTGAFFNPKQESNTALPDIFIINMPAGIKYTAALDEYLLNLSGGITNTTFIFSGEAAEILKENNIESEFGFFISAGLGRRIFKDFILEISPAFQKIFSSPNLNMYRVGIKIIYDL